ncbi:MAG: hypothetical protein JWP52_2401 [Rhizobacter sp.]|nr:hypothetical protein [Rhizobacter sp.]
MDAYLFDWANLLLRWLHVITAIAWIGASFYFVWLDDSLTPPDDKALADKGVSGELWAVHGGGFYNPQKYRGAPPRMPEHLHWFYWEAYSTWLSGFGLLTVLYLFNAGIFLIDKTVYDWSPAAAVAGVIGFLVAGWVVYDLLCRAVGERKNGDRIVGVLIALYVVFATWLACQLFAGRAAFLLTGAMIATIMSANVLMVIIPGQRKVIASMRANEPVDPIHGQRGKQRSVHNTYFTLPVLVAMLSNHYGMLYQQPHNWVVLVALMAAGALIRQYFVLRHKGVQHWAYPVAGVVLILALVGWMAPKPQPAVAAPAAVSFAQVQAVVAQRCVLCHNATLASKNVRLDSPEAMAQHAGQMYQQAVVLKVMPLNNATQITDEERALIGAWFNAGAKTK